MSRRKQGKLAPLTIAERKARTDRNKRRGRSPRAVRWEKDHVKKPRVDLVAAADGRRRGSKWGSK